jgi:hypothetical protein
MGVGLEVRMVLYDLGVIGAPTDDQITALSACISHVIEPFGLRLGEEISWLAHLKGFSPSRRTPSAVAFFGAAGVSEHGLDALRVSGIPILPIVSAVGQISAELPAQLRPLNCLAYATDGPERIATALLECVGLLPRQRRVFLSYRRDEAREAALQLFDALSARVFDVFLDTHGVLPAEDFQTVLWHHLCDSDVLLMLDTAGYFDSRWTSAEYGRALAKGISVLRVGWPGVNTSPRASTASRVDLVADEVAVNTGRLSTDAINRICTRLEFVRGQSHAVRSLNLFSKIKQGVECIEGSVSGVGIHNAVYISLRDKQEIVVYPVVGVPTSLTLNDAVEHAGARTAAVAYDHIGLDKRWTEHLEWLGQNIVSARWVKATETAWTFAGWGLP